MPNRTSKSGSELFIVDNSDEDWKALRYLHDWCPISKAIDIATGYFEIGSLLGLGDAWKQVDRIRILMGNEVSLRTRAAFAAGLANVRGRLDASLEAEKRSNDFLAGVPGIVEAIRSGQIACRVYRKEKFHAKAYLTHARAEVVGSFGLVGSSNFTLPGLTENIELNVQITGRPVNVLQEWYEEHWDAAEDVTPEILRVIERHTREYPPFEVYAKALYELHRRVEPTDREWFERDSRVYPKLDKYQRDGFHNLLAVANNHRGALLCDGVGLGKTYVGLMLLEYFVKYLSRNVVLFVPKAARRPVWERAIEDVVPDLNSGFTRLRIFNHTDLSRGATEAIDFPKQMAAMAREADVVIIDEAHHFRNLGYKGTGERIHKTRTDDRPPSRYYRLYDLIGDTKKLFLLTATPVNNRLTDFQHLVELFSRNVPDYFKALGVHSLPGHIRKLEKELDRQTGGTATELFEAASVLGTDPLFDSLVVQRSRAFVKESQRLHGGAAAVFPRREPPQVAPYSVKKTYGKLLGMVEDAFRKQDPLFTLAIYNPLAYRTGTGPLPEGQLFEAGRLNQVITLIRTQFLKRFESSAHAFEMSCTRLFKKLLAFTMKFSTAGGERAKLDKLQRRHGDLIDYMGTRQRELFPTADDEDEADEDFVPDEMLEAFDDLDPDQFDIPEMLDATRDDLEELANFLKELRQFNPGHDDKLQGLIRLLRTDPVLKAHKVLIFTEFGETARYLQAQLQSAGIPGVDQVDSATKGDRGDIIRRFAPYYNGTSSGGLRAEGLEETRVLISTDVLSEGLNLQDATRLINYDLHWNPVRLMQRIGRVDRRLNPDVERRLLIDHPDQRPLRGQVAFWNFLPPEELNALLSLYRRVTHKTLRISKTFGIEGKQLLTPDDDYEALKNFNHEYEGELSPAERLETEYDTLVQADPSLPERLAALPGRVFSGKAHPRPDSRAVFFCYNLPAADTSQPDAPWTEDAGRGAWYMYNLATEAIVEDPAAIAELIRCTPETPRYRTLPRPTLAETRGRIERHIRSTYLKSVQAPAGVEASLKAWMELS